MMRPDHVIQALAALAQATRLEIFRLLVVAGAEGMSAGQLAESVGIAPASLSFHFKTLSHAGLIESRQEGRFIYYSANFDVMNGMVDYLTENCCGGNAEQCNTPRKKC